MYHPKAWEIDFDSLAIKMHTSGVDTVLQHEDLARGHSTLIETYLDTLDFLMLSPQRYNRLKNELFEFLDTLSEDRRSEQMLRDISNGIYWFNDYFNSRVYDGRISKVTLVAFIHSLFLSGHILVRIEGCVPFIVKLVIDRVFGYDELISMLDEMRASVDYLAPEYIDPSTGYYYYGPIRTGFIFTDGYVPDEELLDLERKSIRSWDGSIKEVVTVREDYINMTFCVDVCKIVLETLFRDGDEIKAAEKIIFILGRWQYAITVLGPCLALVSERRTRRLIKWLLESNECESLFVYAVPARYVTGEQLVVERIVISSCDKLLEEYDTDFDDDRIIARYNYLLENRIAEV